MSPLKSPLSEGRYDCPSYFMRKTFFSAPFAIVKQNRFIDSLGGTATYPFLYFGDIMVFKIDFEHIFFDRYVLSQKEKKNEAFKIIERLFKNAKLDKDGCRMEIYTSDAREEIEFNKKQRLMEREFFVLLSLQQEIEEAAEAPDIIAVAEKYIRENYLYEALCPSRVCEKCGISRKVLDTGFNKRFSKSVSEYIKHIRVTKAVELIKSGEKMENVAYLCGFGSIKTMQRAFKSVYGKTPNEFRGGRLDTKDSK